MSYEDLTWNKVKGRKKIEGIEQRAISSLENIVKPVNVKNLVLYPQKILIHSFNLYHCEFLIDVLPVALRKTLELLPDLLTEQKFYDYENLGLRIESGITDKEPKIYPNGRISMDGFEGKKLTGYSSQKYKISGLLKKINNPKWGLVGEVGLVLHSNNILFQFEYRNKKTEPKIECDKVLIGHLDYHYIDVGMSDTEGDPRNKD